MKSYYSNPTIESDQKKLQRDIQELEKQGVKIRFLKENAYGDYNVYRIEDYEPDRELSLSEEEMETLSLLILKELNKNFQLELFTASQKIFKKNLNLFPKISKPRILSPAEIEEKENLLLNIFTAVKNKNPLRILYFKSEPDDAVEKDIDPIHVLKRNSIDSYLLAYDRKERKKKRYLIPKILRATEINGEFLKDHKTTDSDFNYHQLSFPVREEEELVLECEPNQIYKLKNFLYPHPFTQDGNRITLKVTNRAPLFNFLWKENDVVLRISSSEFLGEFKNYLEDLKSGLNSG